MKTPFCKLVYRQMGPSDLETFGYGVFTGIYGNPTVFATPPIVKADFDDVMTNYSNAVGEYRTIGITKKSAFISARAETLAMLNALATYVDTTAAGEISPIVLSGFTPSSEVTQRTLPLEQIDSFDVLRTTMSGNFIVEIRPITGYGLVYYGCVISEGAPLINPSIVNGQLKVDGENPHVFQDFNKSRRKIFYGFKKATEYYVYVFAMNNVSVSPLSEPRNIMSV